MSDYLHTYHLTDSHNRHVATLYVPQSLTGIIKPETIALTTNAFSLAIARQQATDVIQQTRKYGGRVTRYWQTNSPD